MDAELMWSVTKSKWEIGGLVNELESNSKI